MKPGIYVIEPTGEPVERVVALLENGAEVSLKLSEDETTIMVWHKNPGKGGRVAALSAGASNVILIRVVDAVVDDTKKLKKRVEELESALYAMEEISNRAFGR